MKKGLTKGLVGLLGAGMIASSMPTTKAEALLIDPTQIGQFNVSGEIYDQGVLLNIGYNGSDPIFQGHTVDFSMNYGGQALVPAGGWDITQTLGSDLKTNYNMTTQTDQIGSFQGIINFNGTQPTGLGSAPLDSLMTLSIGYGYGNKATGSIYVPEALTKDLSAPINTPVPEPGTLLLFGTGIVGLLANRQKRQNIEPNYK